MASNNYPYPYSTTTGTITISSTASSYAYSTMAASGFYSTGLVYTSVTQPGLTVSGDSTFDGDITIKGRSLEKLLNTIERRLAILQPNPKKLKKFEALQKAYDHYKVLEALCQEDDTEDGC